ncbi:MAG: hypothetical protein ABI720_13485 [Actinomycetes bacterium]
MNWRNVTVSGDACFSSSPITLHKGYALIPNRNGYPKPPGGDGQRYYQLHIVRLSYGDLKGEPAAAVTFYCSNNGGTGAGRLLMSAAVYSKARGELHELGLLKPQLQNERLHANLVIDGRMARRQVRVVEGVFVTSVSDCCPSGSATTVWTYTEGRFEPYTTLTTLDPQ